PLQPFPITTVFFFFFFSSRRRHTRFSRDWSSDVCSSDLYYFEAAEASFELLLQKAVGRYRPYFELEGLRLLIEKDTMDGEPTADAVIKVRVGDEVIHTAASGNGPVNALDNALRKALLDAYPELAQIHLTDYKVRVLDEDAATGAKVRVLIQTAGGGRSWGTVGVSTNIIEASWLALVDSVEYGLMALGVAPMAGQAAAPAAGPSTAAGAGA